MNADSNAIHRLTVEDVLDQQTAAEYERQRNLLWDSLVLLHNNVILLRRLTVYPRRFLGPASTVVFLTWRNVFENSLVIAHRLWNDSHPQAVSLRTVAKLARSGKLAEHKALMSAQLAAARPRPEISRALREIAKYRNVRLGHLDGAVDLNHPDANLPVALAELEAVAQTLTKYYNATGIGSEAFFELVELEPDMKGRSQVEKLLDGVALQSPFVSRYEEDPEWWWRGYYPKLTPEEYEFVIDLRDRMGLPPMDPRDHGRGIAP